ncbi:MAG: glycoside hydrolase [bacterium]|nr:MAG: glycoside hydrolase [bacterium]
MKPSVKPLHILNLARWYPNRTDPMPGLFIQQHAEAAARFAEVALVYVHGVEAEASASLYEIDYEEKAGVRTARVYYRLPRLHIPFISPAIGLWRFFKANNKGIRRVKLADEKFDIIHVHVLTRLGVLALFDKWFHGTPYVITEHWTRYLDLRDFTGFFRKQLTRMVVRQATVVTTVSNDLTRAMINHGLQNSDYRVIHNVVDTAFFKVTIAERMPKQETGLKELVHVSCFTDVHKNISGLLRVIKKLSENRNDFHFTLVGEGEDLRKIKNYAHTLAIPEKVLAFTGLLEGKILAETMAKADALVIFSNYENMPVVINESFVLGIPVFSTDVGGISEMVNNSNGRLVPKGDETALFDVLDDFIVGKISFQKEQIQAYSGKHFSPDAVGKMLLNIYEEALRKN